MTSVATTPTPTSTNTISDILSQQAAANAASGSSSASSSSSSTSISTTNGALADLSGNYSNFLTLLTTQLQNQDPLSPMDTAQFTQQLVQFSAVEQQINGNAKLDKLIGLQSTANAYGAVSFVGTSVAAKSDQLPLQNGKASFNYTIEHSTSGAALQITNAAGNVVMLKQVDATVGTHPVDWDGTDYFGNQLPDGAYTVSVKYQDATGTSFDAPTTTFGTVDSAEIADGDVSLKLGDVTIPLSDVTTISRPPTETTTGTTTPTTPTTPDPAQTASN